MSYYIDGQANEKTYKLNNGHEVTFHYNDDGIGFATIEFMDAVFERLNNSVEVVRCKDCKNYKKDIPCVGGKYNGCLEWLDEGCATPVNENNFCSYGERKEE